MKEHNNCGTYQVRSCWTWHQMFSPHHTHGCSTVWQIPAVPQETFSCQHELDCICCSSLWFLYTPVPFLPTLEMYIMNVMHNTRSRRWKMGLRLWPGFKLLTNPSELAWRTSFHNRFKDRFHFLILLLFLLFWEWFQCCQRHHKEKGGQEGKTRHPAFDRGCY